MLKRLHSMFGSLRLVILLLATLAALAPAVAAHACVDADCAAVAVSTQTVAATPDAPCSDCGLACANACCHAPHVAVLPEFEVIASRSRFEMTRHWRDQTGLPLDRPSGPERPPRA
jgi:hypothetical protein